VKRITKQTNILIVVKFFYLIKYTFKYLIVFNCKDNLLNNSLKQINTINAIKVNENVHFIVLIDWKN